MYSLLEALLSLLPLRSAAVFYQVNTVSRDILDTHYNGLKCHVTELFAKANDEGEWCGYGEDKGFMPWSRHSHPYNANTSYSHLVEGIDVKETLLTCVELNVCKYFFYNNLSYLHADDISDQYAHKQWFRDLALMCLKNNNIGYFLTILPFIAVSNNDLWHDKSVQLTMCVRLLLVYKSRARVLNDLVSVCHRACLTVHMNGYMFDIVHLFARSGVRVFEIKR